MYRMPEIKFAIDSVKEKTWRMTTQGPYDASYLDKHKCFN